MNGLSVFRDALLHPIRNLAASFGKLVTLDRIGLHDGQFETSTMTSRNQGTIGLENVGTPHLWSTTTGTGKFCRSRTLSGAKSEKWHGHSCCHPCIHYLLWDSGTDPQTSLAAMLLLSDWMRAHHVSLGQMEAASCIMHTRHRCRASFVTLRTSDLVASLMLAL